MSERNIYLYWVGKEYKLISILRRLIYLHSTSGVGYKVNLINNIKTEYCFYYSRYTYSLKKLLKAIGDANMHNIDTYTSTTLHLNEKIKDLIQIVNEITRELNCILNLQKLSNADKTTVIDYLNIIDNIVDNASRF